MAKKKCSRCQEIKPTSEYWANNQKKDGLQYSCKPCTYEIIRASKMKTVYGITLERYNEMFEDQGGVCAICGREQAKRLLAVDHDHDNGNVRGLLCSACNRNVEWFIDNKQSIYSYLIGVK